jgi:Arc/MetJ-type ribon-helix-helix transcriptional regulator
MNQETIIEKFNEQEIAFDLFRGDLMVNATEMAKPFGKRVNNFLVNEQTKAFINALINSKEFQEKNGLSELEFQSTKQSEIIKLVYETRRKRAHTGTYMCEELAIQFAMWLSPEFNVWVIQTIQKIIFGNNPELVREAVMNMPRIQTQLNKLRRKRNRIKAVLLGPDRRKEMNGLVGERNEINRQINTLVSYEGSHPIFEDPNQLGAELIRLIKERDILGKQIRKLDESHQKLLITEEYIGLIKEIGILEKDQKHYSKIIRYSDFKFSDN